MKTFKEWLVVRLERTLYHGTVIDNEPTIKNYGLVGGWHGPSGAFVDDAYGGEYTDDDGNYIEPEEEDQVVFATDKNDLGKAVTAMAFHVGRKLGKDLQDVSDNDMRNHGLLVAIKGSDLKPHEPDKWQDSVPRGVEPGDYYSDRMGADIMLKGAALIRFLRRNGEWPRNWGVNSGGRERLRAAVTNAQKISTRLRSDMYDDEPHIRGKKDRPLFKNGMPSFLQDE
jgi:hypothetical protein